MGKVTAIEWTDATWNPWIGCSKISPACQNCYAERDMKRYGRNFDTITVTSTKTFNSPLTWKEPKKIFVCSWSDFFHPDVWAVHRDKAISVMQRCPQHTFILLTKRPENIELFLTTRLGKEYPKNIWVGVTVENQEQANKRIPLLLKTPAKLKFLSCEPLLGTIDLSNIPGAITTAYNEYHDEVPGGAYERLIEPGGGIDWVIVGGESGPKARPIHPDWVRSLQHQCHETQTPFLFKQWGEFYPDKKGIYMENNTRSSHMFDKIYEKKLKPYTYKGKTVYAINKPGAAIFFRVTTYSEIAKIKKVKK